MALSLTAAVVPIGVSVVATRLAARVVPRPSGLVNASLWWATMLALATAVVFAVGRATRRLTPLAALLKLSLVFPDRAPSRFSVALRAGTVRQLQDHYETIKRDGLGATPAEAARKVVELIGALNAHDRITRGHCERVRAYTSLIAEELKLPAEHINRLRWAGLLHDLGKLEVPSGILNKKGQLDDHEWEIVKTHPMAGARLAAPLAGWLGDAFGAIAEHHERWDGTGYPRRLAGETISLAGRIVAVADAFDVMTAARSYKRPNSPTWARAELVRCTGSQFDAHVVRAFLNVSLGRLRWMIGPLSWLAQTPLLAQAPIASAPGTLATTAMAATIAIGTSTMVTTLPAAATSRQPATTTSTITITAPTRPTATTTSDPRATVPGATTSTVRNTDSTTPVADQTTTTPLDTTTTVATDPGPTSTPPPTSTGSTDPPALTTVATTTVTTTVAPAITTVATTTAHTTIPPTTVVTTTVAAATTTTTAAPATTQPPTTTTTQGNRAPLAVADSGRVTGLLLPEVRINVLDNDSDPDGDRVSIVSFTQPSGLGSVSKHGDQLRYQPLLALPATFTYTISDGHGHTSTATVTITT